MDAAHLYKLIVNTPPGIQEIVEVQKSGSYFDKTLVIWDERTQGPIPKEMLGKVGALIKASDGKLVENAERKRKTDEAKAAREALEKKLKGIK